MPATPRLAGLLYLVIIICGVTSEAVFRAALRADPTLVAQGAGQLRLSMLADLMMALADVGLAVLLLALLRRFGEWLAIGATAFRLVQAAAIIAGLGWIMAAILDAPRAAMWLSIHETGYDVSLAFFAVNCLLTAVLLYRAGVAWLGWAIGLSGVVYGTGSIIRLIAPDLTAVFAPAYALPLLAETAFCIWLLSGAPALFRPPR